MGKLRISVVKYLNTAPLVWGFTAGPLQGRYELSFTVPSLCAEALRGGAADVAIIPAIEYQRIPGLVALPGMAVAAKGPVRSILVIAKRPIERARRVALDTCSRSSAALVRLLCAGRWHIRPEFIEAQPDPAAMLAQADAALLIGDPALQLAIQLEADAGSGAGSEFRLESGLSLFSPADVKTLFVYDVAQEWREMTGQPCVLAIWAVRKEVATPELLADFIASKQFGLARIPQIAEMNAGPLGLPAVALERYLRDNIDFSLDAENRAGLELYFEKCAAAGLIPGLVPLNFAGSPTRAGVGT